MLEESSESLVRDPKTTLMPSSSSLPGSELKRVEKTRFLGFGRSVKWETVIHEKDNEKITITGDNEGKVKNILEFFNKHVNFSSGKIFDILSAQHELIDDGKIHKMIKVCLKKRDEDFSTKHKAINKIKNFESNYKNNGYNKIKLKKAIKLLADNKKIDIKKSSHLEAVGILYAHLKNLQNFQNLPDDVSREEINNALNKCIKFCEEFELLEVCSAGQEVLTITTKVPLEGFGLEYVTDMLAVFKRETESATKTNKEKQTQKTVDTIKQYASEPEGNRYDLMYAVELLNDPKYSVGFNLRAVGAIYAHLIQPEYSLSEGLNDKQLYALQHALEKCVEFLQTQQNASYAKHEDLNKMLNVFNKKLKILKFII